MKYIYFIFLLTSCGDESIKNLNQLVNTRIDSSFTQIPSIVESFDSNSSIVNIVINKDVSISQKLGSDTVRIKCHKNRNELLISNYTLSDFSIPKVSIEIVNNGENSISYFLNSNTFYLGLLGINKSMNLYMINILKKDVRLLCTTNNNKFYIDTLKNELITTSNLNEVDSLFSLKVNKYNLTNFELITETLLKFPHEQLDSILTSDPSSF